MLFRVRKKVYKPRSDNFVKGAVVQTSKDMLVGKLLVAEPRGLSLLEISLIERSMPISTRGMPVWAAIVSAR